ncbi:MAG: dienelactone hydrolase family protein [Sinobacteraceae bacterium]|nr:dienelactone hydrolase family protein [Nevskiaceae bacterium]
MNRGSMIRMKMNDGAQIGVYHVEPSGLRPGGLVLIQEIFGLTEHIKTISDEFARDGYEVLAPSLFDREEPGFVTGYTPDEMQRAIKMARQTHPFHRSVADACACVSALRDKGPVFMVGYCYGGSVVWVAACQCDGLAAASSYYGSQLPAMADRQPKCPVIAHFGKHDSGIPLDGVKKFEAAHPEVPVHIYDAGHGFNSDRPDHHNDAAAKLARQRTLDLFRAKGR